MVTLKSQRPKTVQTLWLSAWGGEKGGIPVCEAWPSGSSLWGFNS